MSPVTVTRAASAVFCNRKAPDVHPALRRAWRRDRRIGVTVAEFLGFLFAVVIVDLVAKGGVLTPCMHPRMLVYLGIISLAAAIVALLRGCSLLLHITCADGYDLPPESDVDVRHFQRIYVALGYGLLFYLFLSGVVISMTLLHTEAMASIYVHC